MFFVMVTFLFVGVFYFINLQHLRRREVDSIVSASYVRVQIMENIVRDMEQVVHTILSDSAVISSFRVFSDTEFESLEEFLFCESVSTIQSQINLFGPSNRFYKIIAFNRYGFAISNRSFLENVLINSDTTQIENLSYMNQLLANQGRGILVGLQQQNWQTMNDTFVISYAVGVEYSNLGFIEVQVSKQALDDIFINNEMHYSFLFLTSSKDFFYATENEYLQTESIVDLFQNANEDSSNGVIEIIDENGRRRLAYLSHSDTFGFYLITMSEANVRGQLFLTVLPLSLIVLIGGVIVSIIFINLTSRHLTKPILQLQNLMENTQLANMITNDPLAEMPDDEIKTLYTAYKSLLLRLDKSIVKNEQLSIMQLQSQFDLLQAQVNPHFIFNVLNVISNRGVILDDDITCEICRHLALMLRYSTNTKDKFATVQTEINYVELYLSLLKYRYENKLSYSISLASEICNNNLPRIVVQQIVENAIEHGMGELQDNLHIEVVGKEISNGWQIKVSDNGVGISEDALAQIETSWAKLKEKLSDNRHSVELEIGGMGLVSSFARLFILYQDNFEMEVKPLSSGGTTVTIKIIS